MSDLFITVTFKAENANQLSALTRELYLKYPMAMTTGKGVRLAGWNQLEGEEIDQFLNPDNYSVSKRPEGKG